MLVARTASPCMAAHRSRRVHVRRGRRGRSLHLRRARCAHRGRGRTPQPPPEPVALIPIVVVVALPCPCSLSATLSGSLERNKKEVEEAQQFSDDERRGDERLYLGLLFTGLGHIQGDSRAHIRSGLHLSQAATLANNLTYTVESNMSLAHARHAPDPSRVHTRTPDAIAVACAQHGHPNSSDLPQRTSLPAIHRAKHRSKP